ncbi:complement C1q tumor necrosis factor-related protein 4-like [Ornithodoros turicata]|uniref:complement C1q tumor necrosis factor-related protein 4-like n=1 Tax=Ornithodoros turicata TaxID=34597 RepID=UPI003139260C
MLAWIVAVLACFVACVTGQVGFTMTQAAVDGNYLRFSLVPTNYRADITKELGAFRCNIPGLYHFAFSAMAPSHGAFRMSLRRNRVPIVTSFASDHGFSWTSNSALLYLNPNDLVYLFLEEGDIYESTAVNRAFTSFTGHLVNADHLMGRNSGDEDTGEPDEMDDIFERLSRITRN